MKKRIAAAGAALLLALSTPALASASPLVTIDGVPVGAEAMATTQNNTTYVSLRTISTALDSNALVSWEKNTAYVRTDDLLISARPGETSLTVNGEIQPVPFGVLAAQGRTLVPIRVLAQAFGASVHWDPMTGEVSVLRASDDTSAGYTDEDLYWLSRIISAESRGEPLDGKIAVGNVVLNRVASADFPDTIYDVIFDDRWGGQFEPVRNGTVYQEPTEESVQAAKLCLEGKNVAGDCMYFIAPALAQNFWVPQNREYVMTIGCHDFYR